MKTSKSVCSTPIGDVTLFTLTNSRGAKVVLSSLGAGIVAIEVPDKEGKLDDVVIGYSDPASYIADGPCAGKTPGRYANRIALGKFTLEGKEYHLPINNGPNHLHGGPDGFQNRIWNVEEVAPGKIRFTLEDTDGNAGYPATLKAAVTYTWHDDTDRLDINYDATSDQPTVVNLTNHSYFNLGGHAAGPRVAMDQLLRLNSSKWLPTDSTLVPFGDLAPVEGTPMDFRTLRPVGEQIFPADATPSTETLDTSFEAIRFGKGYDNCWASDNAAGTFGEIAFMKDPESGRTLNVMTDQPGVQIYTGNWVSGSPAGKDGAVYQDYCAVAIECQGFPDAPNKPQFPSQEVTPSNPYHRSISFIFNAE